MLGGARALGYDEAEGEDEMMTEQPSTEPIEEQAETIEVLATVFQDWKVTHPDGTWRDFWTAVGNGEVQMPG
jgi:hypothetical protein